MPSINVNGSEIQLPDYAMQHTLESLYHVMAGMSAEQAKDFGTLANAFNSNSDVGRQTKASVDDLQPPLETIATSSRQNVQQTSLTLKQMRKGIKDANKNAATQSTAFRQTAQIMRGAGQMMTGGGMSDLASLLPGKLASSLGTATKVLQRFADTQRNLTDVGMGLGTSIIKTTKAVSQLNMPIFEFERVAGKYSLALDSLNDSSFKLTEEFAKLQQQGVHKGAIMFSNLSNEVRKSMEPFGNLGLTVTEINTYLGEYLESDRKRSVNTQTSFETLTTTFSHLVKEASAYAIDTGRSRKALIKAQIDTLTREDAAGYAMRMRMKGEDEAAENFETNAKFLALQLHGRFGEAGDAFKEMILQGAMTGRGLEATAEGANLGAMYGEAGAVMNEIIKGMQSEKLDPALLAKFSEALKTGTNNFDKHNFAIQKANNASLGLVEAAQLQEKNTTAASRADALLDEERKERLKQGALILKGNELYVQSTAVLQHASSRVVDRFTGPNGLGPALDATVDALSDFLKTMQLFSKGDFQEGAEALYEYARNHPVAAVVGTAFAVQTGRSVLGLGKNRSADQRAGMAESVAAKNIESKYTPHGQGGIKIGNQQVKAGGTFTHEGVQYKLDNKGVPKVTPEGIKALTNKGGMSKAIKAGGAASLMAAAFVAWDTIEEYQAAGKHYDALIKKAEKEGGVGAGSALRTEKNTQQQNIIGRGFAQGGGSVLGGMLGTGLGSVLGPIGTFLGGIAGTIGGHTAGDELWNIIGKDIIEWMNANDEKDKEKETESAIYKLLEKIEILLGRLLSSNEIQTDTGLILAGNAEENSLNKNKLAPNFGEQQDYS